MVINIGVQYNGGFLPDIILLTQGYYHWGTLLNTMSWLCIYSPCNRVDAGIKGQRVLRAVIFVTAVTLHEMNGTP